MIRRRTITSYEWHVATGNETVVLLNCVKSFFRRLELIGGTEQLTTTGINLLPYKVGDEIKSSLGKNTAVFKEDGVIITVKDKDSTSTGDIYFFGNSQGSLETGYSDKVKAGDYTILSNLKLCTFYVVAWRNGTNTIIINNSDKQIIHFSVLEGDKIRLFVRMKNSIGTEKAQIMLCKHTDVKLPYEPYTGLKPSPNPEYPQEIKSAGKYDEASGKYLLDVKVTGKNLFNAEKAKSGWITTDGKQTLVTLGNSDNVVSDYIQVYSGMKYTSSVGVYKYFYDSEKIFLKQDASISSSIIIPDNAKYMIVIVPVNKALAIQTANTLMINIGSSVLQIENGTIRSNYEPYKEQTLTITSDRPLTKWDKLVEQDGQYGWLYGSGIKTFESDVFKLYSDNDKAIQYQVPFEEITNSWDKSVCYCNTFENVTGQTIYTQSGKTDFYIGCVHKSMVFSAKNKQGIFANIETFQEWIRNSGTYVWHRTDNKKFVPLSEPEQTQLRSLHSYNGTTHITVDSGEIPCGINVEYKTKS